MTAVCSGLSLFMLALNRQATLIGQHLKKIGKKLNENKRLTVTVTIGMKLHTLVMSLTMIVIYQKLVCGGSDNPCHL